MNIDKMVGRFLSWPLPKGFCPDCGISFDGRKDDQWNKNKTWPTGTNLFSADQAREMLQYMLSDDVKIDGGSTDDRILITGGSALNEAAGRG